MTSEQPTPSPSPPTPPPEPRPAAPAPAPAAPTTPAAPITGREHAPPVGTRVEVLWHIEPAAGDDDDHPDNDDPAAPHERWWGAVVQDCTPDRAGPSLAPAHPHALVHILLYDAYSDFAEDTARVVFLPQGVLIDLARAADEDRGLLDWRVEQPHDPAAPHPDLRAQPLSLAQVASHHDDLVRQAGLPRDADLTALSQLPTDVQLHMTSGYRMFADGVKEMLAELMRTKPPGYVVTEADVQDIFAKIQAARKNAAQVGAGM